MPLGIRIYSENNRQRFVGRQCAHTRQAVGVTGVAVATPFTSRELEKRADFFRISGAGSG